MSQVKRSIFRDSAIQRYRLRRGIDVLPRFVRPPVFMFLWILLSLCLLAGFLTWDARIPIYVSASGVIVQNEQSGQLQALLFVSTDRQYPIRPGQSVQLQIGATGPHLQLVVTGVVPQLLSPAQIRTQYHLNSTLSLVVSQPSAVAVVTLTGSAARQEYAGSLVSARVQIGSRSALSLFPLLDRIIS